MEKLNNPFEKLHLSNGLFYIVIPEKGQIVEQHFLRKMGVYVNA